MLRIPITIGAWILVLASLPSLHATAAEFRAWWVDTWSPAMMNEQQISQLVADARAGNFNALIVEVRRRGDAFYNSKLEPKVAGVAEDFDPLADLLAKAHDRKAGQRLQVHCWLVTYPMSNGTNKPPQPNHPLNLHPDWMNRTASGAITDGHNYYFDPGHPGVQQHTFEVAMDLLTRYDIDGINWDYIRYPGPEWGYNPVTVARFNSRFGRTGQPAKDDPEWMQFRRDQITALLRKVYLSALAIKPHVIHSVDTFGVRPNDNKKFPWLGSGAYRVVLQDWRAWMEEGIVDLNVPMTYMDHETHANEFAFSSAFTTSHRYNRFALIGPATYENTISNGIVQIRSTRETTREGNRAEGVACYSYAAISKNRNSREELVKALTQPTSHDPIRPPVFADKVLPPEMPWKTSPAKGHLKGFVRDDISNLDGANITLDGPEKRTLLSDATGFYGAVDLVPGLYTIKASFPGCADLSETVLISAGVVAETDLFLVPANLAIALQPQDQSVVAGKNLQLRVRGVGVKPLKYQWLHNGTAVPQGTNEMLLFSRLQADDAGDYVVIVSNASGSITSATAKVNCEFELRGSTTGNGSVSFVPKRDSYSPGSGVIVYADPELGFTFSHWTGGITHSNNPFKLFVSSNVSLSAHFTPSTRDVILDNQSAQFSGSWGAGSSSPDRYGADYHIAPNTNVAATATYRPLIGAPGNYDVLTWYPQGGNRSTNAAFIVSHSKHSITSIVNQTSGGGGWRPIATTVYFEAGTNGFVRLQNNPRADGRFVMADAVRFAWSKTQMPPVFEEARLRRASQKNSYLLTNFETNQPGSTVLFHPSGHTSEFMEPKSSPSVRVTNRLPAGNSSSNALLVKMNFADAKNTNHPWLRLTTHNAPVIPNPTVSLEHTIAFAVYVDRPVYISAGLRETDTTAPIGADGKTEGPIEWIGGTTDNTTNPPKGRFVPAGQWVWVEFFIPTEPVRAFTGNGVLESMSGKAVLEELAIVPADGTGPYHLHLDEIRLISPFE